MRITTHRLPGLVLTDHEFAVPLDHAKPDGETITVFAREVVVPDKENDDLPWLIFFQGGPGFGSPRPGTRSGWLKRALKEYRVLLLDQRGTGRSTPVTHQTLARFPSPQAQADYLKLFRADAIVQDAEWIRKELLEDAFVQGPSGRELSYGFLRGFEKAQSFDTNPIYAILHESIYCQQDASNWSAQRVRAEFPEFDLAPGKPVAFTGEMIYPWMFDEYEPLKPLKQTAEILAAYDGWPRLYDVSTLQKNTVPCTAAVYYNDMYVDRGHSEETARKIQGIKLWVTSKYEHNGLRSDGEAVLGRLLDMLHGEA